MIPSLLGTMVGLNSGSFLEKLPCHQWIHRGSRLESDVDPVKTGFMAESRVVAIE